MIYNYSLYFDCDFHDKSIFPKAIDACGNLFYAQLVKLFLIKNYLEKKISPNQCLFLQDAF